MHPWFNFIHLIGISRAVQSLHMTYRITNICRRFNCIVLTNLNISPFAFSDNLVIWLKVSSFRQETLKSVHLCLPSNHLVHDQLVTIQNRTAHVVHPVRNIKTYKSLSSTSPGIWNAISSSIFPVNKIA